MSAELHLIARIGSARVAIPAAEVEAVVRIGRVVPVHGAPSVVAGLVTLRSRLLTLIDSAAVVGERGGAPQLMAIISHEGHGYALALDEVEDVAPLEGAVAPPMALAPGWARVEPMVAEWRGGMLLLFSPGRLIAAARPNAEAA